LNFAVAAKIYLKQGNLFLRSCVLMHMRARIPGPLAA
jgi:hypothetical protein